MTTGPAEVARNRLSTRLVVALVLVAGGWWAVLSGTEQSAARMATAAEAFVSALSDDQRRKAVFDYGSDERQRWHFIPNEMFSRRGLTFRAMTPGQRDKAQALIRAGLSQRGYLTTTAIIQLEDVLRGLENSPRFARSPLDYHVTVFGRPGPRGDWGWRVEGHHLSLHFAVRDGQVLATSPTFTGANPAEVVQGPRQGLRVLASLEDAGRVVVETLTPQQLAVAVVAFKAPNDIVSANKHDIGPLSPAGLPVARMTGPQRDKLRLLLDVYASFVAPDLAADRIARIDRAGFDQVTFAWAGPTARGAKHYYRLQGPTFLIEYDNTQNDGNHIHAVWRDFQGDFGRDVLAEHLAADHVR